jgi:hypothetical protein
MKSSNENRQYLDLELETAVNTNKTYNPSSERKIRGRVVKFLKV